MRGRAVTIAAAISVLAPMKTTMQIAFSAVMLQFMF
jgi:hypothetical protein